MFRKLFLSLVLLTSIIAFTSEAFSDPVKPASGISTESMLQLPEDLPMDWFLHKGTAGWDGVATVTRGKKRETIEWIQKFRISKSEKSSKSDIQVTVYFGWSAFKDKKNRYYSRARNQVLFEDVVNVDNLNFIDKNNRVALGWVNLKKKSMRSCIFKFIKNSSDSGVVKIDCRKAVRKKGIEKLARYLGTKIYSRISKLRQN